MRKHTKESGQDSQDWLACVCMLSGDILLVAVRTDTVRNFRIFLSFSKIDTEVHNSSFKARKFTCRRKASWVDRNMIYKGSCMERSRFINSSCKKEKVIYEMSQ